MNNVSPITCYTITSSITSIRKQRNNMSNVTKNRINMGPVEDFPFPNPGYSIQTGARVLTLIITSTHKSVLDLSFEWQLPIEKKNNNTKLTIY